MICKYASHVHCFLMFSVKSVCVNRDGHCDMWMCECVCFLQGVGGAVQYPKNFLKEAYKLVRERGGVCIADEVRHLF